MITKFKSYYSPAVRVVQLRTDLPLALSVPANVGNLSNEEFDGEWQPLFP
ncbi:MAG: hypothetical protein IJU13_07285 [Bacteroidales bacterium]|nr:hypothetical protein [Bacteroidales bacterium]